MFGIRQEPSSHNNIKSRVLLAGTPCVYTVEEETFANCAREVGFAPTEGRCCTAANVLGPSVGASIRDSAASAKFATHCNKLKRVKDKGLGCNIFN
jgi:hypothetical protein